MGAMHIGQHGKEQVPWCLANWVVEVLYGHNLKENWETGLWVR